jgi:hypothetical protein
LSSASPAGKETDKGGHWSLFCRALVQQTLDKCFVNITWGCDGLFSLPDTRWQSTKSLPSARHKVLDKETVVVQFTETSLSRVSLAKEFVERFVGFCHVSEALSISVLQQMKEGLSFIY